MARTPAMGTWVLLSYHLPREPSTPRITVWRKLKRLGVAQLGDGLVTLPADARTREHLDWIAEEVLEAGGSAGVWLAQPTAPAQEHAIVEAMTEARAQEYRGVLADALQAAGTAESDRRRALRRLRGELHRISRRDYFPPPEREAAENAVAALRTEDNMEDTA